MKSPYSREVNSSNLKFNSIRVKQNNNTMILNFAVNFNDYNEKILNFYGIWDFRCPCCNAFRSFSRHALYSRHICILMDNQIIEKKLNILRLKCKSCDTTHAVLPSDVIPYMFYSLSCVLMYLSEYFIENQSVLCIFEKFKISYQLIYQFIKRFINHFKPCINFLRIFLSLEIDFDSSHKSILSFINTNFILSDFQFQYLNFSNSVFLMTRRQNILSRQIHIGSYFKPPT
jgi:hypothetical protein